MGATKPCKCGDQLKLHMHVDKKDGLTTIIQVWDCIKCQNTEGSFEVNKD